MMEIIACSCGCGTELNKYDSKHRIRKYISGHNSKIENPNKVEKIIQTCRACNKVYYKAPSLANRGKNTYCSNTCRSKSAKEWMGASKNINWLGGRQAVQDLRWAPEYKIWRIAVFTRDLYTCQSCGLAHTRQNPLHAHHKVAWAINEELRFSIDNGITLCKECHTNAHKVDRFRKTDWTPSKHTSHSKSKHSSKSKSKHK